MKHLIVLAIVSTIASHALHGDPEFDVWYIDIPTCKDHNCNSSSWWETKKLPPYLCCCSDYKDQNVCCKCSDYKLLMDARKVTAIHGIPVKALFISFITFFVFLTCLLWDLLWNIFCYPRWHRRRVIRDDFLHSNEVVVDSYFSRLPPHLHPTGQAGSPSPQTAITQVVDIPEPLEEPCSSKSIPRLPESILVVDIPEEPCSSKTIPCLPAITKAVNISAKSKTVSHLSSVPEEFSKTNPFVSSIIEETVL